jgi:hypothetical protein
VDQLKEDEEQHKTHSTPQVKPDSEEDHPEPEIISLKDLNKWKDELEAEDAHKNQVKEVLQII